jgi:hypothetical protein
MNGKNLAYRQYPGGDDFLLYSVGEDGKDDHGNPGQLEEKKAYRQIWDGRDAVWPRPATLKEAKLAVGTSKHD